MNLLNRQKIGQHAEREACRFLQAQGLRLLEQNYRCYQGEIDLIMQDKNEIVFVEVRSRSRIDFGKAGETINKSKQKKLIKAGMRFLQQKEWLFKVNSRFDVIAIHFLADKLQLEWIKSAFLAED
jgi:putative endonuclease